MPLLDLQEAYITLCRSGYTAYRPRQRFVLLVRERSHAHRVGKASTQSCEAAHPDPSQVRRWGKLYDKAQGPEGGIRNEDILEFARDLGWEPVPPIIPTPAGYTQVAGPWWTAVGQRCQPDHGYCWDSRYAEGARSLGF